MFFRKGNKENKEFREHNIRYMAILGIYSGCSRRFWNDGVATGEHIDKNHCRT